MNRPLHPPAAAPAADAALDTTAAPAANATAARNRLSPKKLLLSKWTAVAPTRREKHFVVVRVLESEPPAQRVEQVELEAVHSGRSFVLPWRELTDGSRWRQGWL